MANNLKQNISLETSEQILMNQTLVACRSCGRKFNREAWLKHEKVCSLVFGARRGEFDSKTQRLGSRNPIVLLSNGTKGRN